MFYFPWEQNHTVLYYGLKYSNFGHYASSGFFKQGFGDWILSPSSGKSLLCWAQSTELISITGYQSQRQIGYINQT
jgi:hypothetical protein